MRNIHFTSARALMLAAGLAVLATGAQARTARHYGRPDPRDAKIEALEQQVAALAAKVDSLTARAEAPPPAPTVVYQPAPPPPRVIVEAAAMPPAPLPPANGGVTILAGKPQIASGDARFTANLHGVMQFDTAQYLQDPARASSVDLRRGAAATDTARARDLSSGTNFRRGRIGIDGKVFGDFEYNLLYEFGGAGEEDAGHIQELWIQYSGIAPFHLRAGAFPPSVGLEDQGATNGALFPERPASADIARSVAGGDFREGAMLWAAGDRWFAAGSVSGRSVGVVNSQATGVTQPYDSALGLLGRVVIMPVKTDDLQLQIGVHGSYVARTADTGGPDTAVGAVRYGVTLQERPELRVDGTRLISTGALDAKHASTLGLELAGQWKGLVIQSEVERYDIERRNPAPGVTDPDFSGWYVEGSYILSGERRRFNANTFTFDAPPVDHPFSLAAGTWGAWELAARWADIDLNYHEGVAGAVPLVDSVRGGDQRIISGGLNWYPNAVVRFLLGYQDVRIDRLSPSAASFVTPAGAQVGQHYQVVYLRSQFAF